MLASVSPAKNHLIMKADLKEYPGVTALTPDEFVKREHSLQRKLNILYNWRYPLKDKLKVIKDMKDILFELEITIKEEKEENPNYLRFVREQLTYQRHV